jgi:hypothetical protein
MFQVTQIVRFLLEAEEEGVQRGLRFRNLTSSFCGLGCDIADSETATFNAPAPIYRDPKGLAFFPPFLEPFLEA